VVTPGVRASGVVIAQLTVRTGKCVLGSVNAQGHRTDQHAGTWSAEGLHFKGGGSCSTPPPSPTRVPTPPPSPTRVPNPTGGDDGGGSGGTIVVILIILILAVGGKQL
jgi:hypothetical protein